MPPPRSWLLQPTCEPELGIAGWSWLLPGAASALAWLRAHGVRRGMRVGLAGAGTPGTAALIQAAPLAGATLVLFNRRLTAGELGRQVAAARLDLLAADPSHPLAAGTGAMTPIAVPESFPDTALDRALLSPAAPEDPALVLFTSGTTGEPKAARLPLRALTHSVAAACARLRLGPADIWLGCLPLDHIGGAGLVLRSAACGYRLRLCERFDAETAGHALDHDGITGLSVVPTMLHRLIECRSGRRWPATLRVILTGGGPLSAAACARSAALGLEPCQTYGLTECASQVCTLAPEEAAAHRGSAGRPLDGVEVAIAGANGEPLAHGSGAILVRGPVVFSGYESGGAIVAPPSPDAWFATGDLGAIDAAGFLSVDCRREDLIVSGGENVYPTQVEGILAEHPAVREALVCGIPDEEWGQVVAAVLVADGTPPGDAELRLWMQRHLAGHQLPRRWMWARELPRSALGKLARTIARQWINAGER